MKKKTPNKTRHSWRKTYNHVLARGTTERTQKNYTRDLCYFWEWVRLALKRKSHYPVVIDTLLQFIVEHAHEMPIKRLQALLKSKHRRKPGPLKINTVRRILSALSVAHSVAGHISPVSDDRVKLLMRRLRRGQAGEPGNQKKAITADILEKLLATCGEDLRSVRDRAMMLVAFSSGGRRRSELVAMQINDLEKIDQGYLLQLRKQKNDQLGEGRAVPVLGSAAKAVRQWLLKSGLRDGPLFRGIWGKGKIGESIEGRAINRMIKRRLVMIGMDPADYGAHSLRSGFITEGGKRGTHLRDLMALSCHSDFEVAHGYYRQGELLANPAAYLLSGDSPESASKSKTKGERS